ncbi:MAG: glycosyltransferase, partial [Pseudomonadota bacterium]
AYGEDSDLAMRVRQQGLTVYYQPLSRVVHYEGVTSGTDTSSGIKAYQVTNAEKLHTRWADEFANRPVPGSDPHQAKDLGVEKRILIIDALTPQIDYDAGSLTCFEIIRICQELGYQVTFIPGHNLARIKKYTDHLQKLGVEAIYWPYCASIKNHLEEFGARYEAVLVFRVTVLWEIFGSIREHAPAARLIFHTADVHHLREERQAALENDAKLAETAAVTRQREFDLFKGSDVTIVHSEHETDYIREQVPGAHVETFNWVLDPVATDTPFEDRNGCFFLGGYQHIPNVDAVKYFIETIWPHAEAGLDDPEFSIVGSNAPADLRVLAKGSVKFLGFVEDLGDIMNRSRMSVAPLRYGAGVKGKISMSLAYGVPVVTTTMGAEGMGLRHEVDALIADDPEEFAREIVRLHSDKALWDTLSRGGQAYVEENLSRAAGVRLMRRIIGENSV